MRAVPNIDDENIREHCVRYDKYLEMTEGKKDLLNKYKDCKKRQ